MSIQWNLRWRAFDKGISIYRHYCSEFTTIRKKKKKKWDSGTGTTLIGTDTTCAKSGSGHSVPVAPGGFGEN